MLTARFSFLEREVKDARSAWTACARWSPSRTTGPVAAAQWLHLAPPTVSLHIAELESRIGAPLLSRTRGNVRPSAIGEVLVERARRLLAEVESTLDDVQRQVQGCPGAHASAHRPGRSRTCCRRRWRLRDAHPDIDVQIAVLTSHDTLARIAQGTLDVGLVALPQTAVAGLSIRAWRRDPVMAFLPADWPLPARVTPGSAARPLILNDATTRLSRLTTNGSRSAPPPEPRIELNYNDAIKSLVAAGYARRCCPMKRAPRYPIRIVMRALRPALA